MAFYMMAIRYKQLEDSSRVFFWTDSVKQTFVVLYYYEMHDATANSFVTRDMTA